VKKQDVTALVSRRAIATHLTVKAVVTDSGICFKSWRRLQCGGMKNFTMRNIRALLQLMEHARVQPAERYIELEEEGERIIAMRLRDFQEAAGRSAAPVNQNN